MDAAPQHIQAFGLFILGLYTTASMHNYPLALLAEHRRCLRAHGNHAAVSWFAEAEWSGIEWSAVRGCGLGFSEVMVILPWESGEAWVFTLEYPCPSPHIASTQ